MLKQIAIHNFVLIKDLVIDFSPGLTVVSGETGAGKSIILDALQLLLGGRPDFNTISKDQKEASIQATFCIQNLPAVQAWLKERNFPVGPECCISRILMREGRLSKSYLNAKSISSKSLKDISDLLLNLYGQHNQYALFKQDTQRQCIDTYGQYAKVLMQVKKLFLTIQQMQHQLEEKKKQLEYLNLRKELLAFQVAELKALNIEEGEILALEHEYQRLAKIDQIVKACNQGLDYLTQEEYGINALMRKLENQISPWKEIDPHLQMIAQLIQTTTIECKEVSADLQNYIENIQTDPERLYDIEKRLAELDKAAHKYKVKIIDLPILSSKLEEELYQIEVNAISIKQLEEEIEAAIEEYKIYSAQLSQNRYQASRDFEKQVTQIMQALGIKEGKFKVNWESIPMSAEGLEKANFMLITNPKEPWQPLINIVSGGELSRIALAIQIITAKVAQMPTLIFDEVDVGVSGNIAAIIGQLLRNVGKEKQVLCITHLPQVAAHGHQHLCVSKILHPIDHAYTQIEYLYTEQQRIEELARMLGGLKITAQTRAHAKALLDEISKEAV